MKRVMLLVLVLIFATETPSAQREEKGIEIVFKAQDKQINPYQEEYEKMLYSTVRISSSSGVGSGVVISVERRAISVEQIAILTACHVVDDQSVVNVELYDSTIITGTVVITDTVKDLALLSIEYPASTGLNALRPTLYAACLAPKDYTPYIFTPIYTVGCSLGLSPRPSNGIITVVDKDHWEVSSPVLPGNSGGPVYDKYTYQVIGIAVWVKVYDGQLITTMAGIVPINEIYKFLEPLINTNEH
ncbi:MAG: serine protease [Planctomycetota bacterium]